MSEGVEIGSNPYSPKELCPVIAVPAFSGLPGAQNMFPQRALTLIRSLGKSGLFCANTGKSTGEDNLVLCNRNHLTHAERQYLRYRRA
jgi:hypothetical protein